MWVKNALERYEDVDPSFTGSRECALLKGLADAAEEAGTGRSVPTASYTPM